MSEERSEKWNDGMRAMANVEGREIGIVKRDDERFGELMRRLPPPEGRARHCAVGVSSRSSPTLLCDV